MEILVKNYLLPGTCKSQSSNCPRRLTGQNSGALWQGSGAGGWAESLRLSGVAAGCFVGTGFAVVARAVDSGLGLLLFFGGGRVAIGSGAGGRPGLTAGLWLGAAEWGLSSGPAGDGSHSLGWGGFLGSGWLFRGWMPIIPQGGHLSFIIYSS